MARRSRVRKLTIHEIMAHAAEKEMVERRMMMMLGEAGRWYEYKLLAPHGGHFCGRLFMFGSHWFFWNCLHFGINGQGRTFTRKPQHGGGGGVPRIG